MNRHTRRQFLAQMVASGVVGWRGLRAQAPIAVSVPGLDAGEPTSSMALRNVTVIDGTGKPARRGMTVVIAGDRIESLGPAGEAPLGPRVQVIDASGKFLIPGLWDMHAHGVAGGQKELSPLFIPNGVTGVRTMGGANRQIVQGFVQMRGEIAAGKRLGPRLVVGSLTLVNISNPENGRIAVRAAVQDGADFIKVRDGISRAGYFAIADEAKKSGKTFVGHVSNPGVSLEDCVAAGQKSLEHVASVLGYLRSLSDSAGPPEPGNLTRSQQDGLCALFRQNDTSFCPTLTAAIGPSADATMRQDPRLKYIEAAERASWAAGPSNANRRRQYEAGLQLVRMMHDGGVRILAGTDAGGPGPAYCLPGFGIHDELGHLVAAGLSPMDALRTATYNAAEFLGLSDSLGTVEPGKRAELVMLDANPLDKIENTQTIDTVFTGGRAYRKPVLTAMFDAIATNARN